MIIDTSEELQIERYCYGIKLIRPQKRITNHALSDILKLPFQVYFQNIKHTLLKTNEITANELGFGSLEECIDTEWYKPFKYKTVIATLKNNSEIFTNEKYIIEEESGLRLDKTEVHSLSIKMPWYSSDNKIIGLFGFSIILGQASLAESLLKLANLGLLNPGNNLNSAIGTEINNTYLSKRQTSCARLLLNGKTAKEIALSLNLSHRTVEHYIETIKNKFNCYSKAELILKLSELFNS